MNYKHLATEFWSFLDRVEIRSHQSNASNSVYFLEGEVVGILDFEFATLDLRLMDYLCGLEHFAQFPWQDKSHWEAVKAFHRGYKQYVSLINLEVEAIATVWRLQGVSSIIYWTGWFREGKVTHQSIANGVSKMLLLEDWLKNNTAKLQDYLV